ncbi:hypothetical protein ACFC0S_17110 [Streptomyces sp. NPDC056084]|uniref:hypothetical protein n=1 Tax=unclassified Streptomyces TaxID=2593676 RepID=UPI0035DB4FCB
MTAREDILAGLRAAPAVGDAPPEELVDALEREVRAEIAADIRRAELPSFPAGESADLVAKMMRAIDARIAEQGAEAPYGVAGQSLTPQAAQIRLAQYGDHAKSYDSGTEKALYEIALTLNTELVRMRDRLDAVLNICDREERGALSWENPIPVPDWVGAVQRAALGDESGSR